MEKGASLSPGPAHEKSVAARQPKPKYLRREETDEQED